MTSQVMCLGALDWAAAEVSPMKDIDGWLDWLQTGQEEMSSGQVAA